MSGDGGGTLLPGESTGAGQVPGVHRRVGSGVSGVTSPGPERENPGNLVDAHPPTPPPRLYRVSFPRAYGLVGCLVEGCRGQASTRTNLRIHFVHFHMRYTIIILEEGNRHHPFCSLRAYRSCGVALVHRRPRNKHVAGRSEGVVTVTFL